MILFAENKVRVMETVDAKQKIDKYVSNAFRAAQLKENDAAQLEMDGIQRKLASKGSVLSGAMDHEMIRVHSEKINRLLKVRGDALLDAYEIYDVPFDEDAIVNDVEGIRETLISATSNSAREKDSLFATRTGHNDPSAGMRYNNFKRQLTIKSQTIADELICQIEQRRIAPKMKRPEAGISITYHLRDNARVNIQSTDKSVNTITVSQEQLFSEVRNAITQQVAAVDQGAILHKLGELQQAQGTKSFGEKLSAFIAAAADYMTILTPFMPALAELAKKYIGS